MLRGSRQLVTRKSSVSPACYEEVTRKLAIFRPSRHVKMVWRVANFLATSRYNLLRGSWRRRHQVREEVTGKLVPVEFELYASLIRRLVSLKPINIKCGLWVLLSIPSWYAKMKSIVTQRALVVDDHRCTPQLINSLTYMYTFRIKPYPPKVYLNVCLLNLVLLKVQVMQLCYYYSAHHSNDIYKG